jgi:hypothetical protein
MKVGNKIQQKVYLPVWHITHITVFDHTKKCIRAYNFMLDVTPVGVNVLKNAVSKAITEHEKKSAKSKRES